MKEVLYCSECNKEFLSDKVSVCKDCLRVIDALEHSDIINQNGILLDEDLNLCLDANGNIYLIPKEDFKYFRVWNDELNEFMKGGLK